MFVFGHHASLFIEQRPFSKAFMQHDSIKMNGNRFEVRTSPQQFSNNGLVFHRVHAAGGIHQCPARYKQCRTALGDVNLHLEHLSAFFWRPIPPNITVLSRCGRARARYIRKNEVKTRRREASKMTTVVLGHHHVGEAQATSIADEHVQPPGDRFVRDHHAMGMKSFAQLCCFRSRCSAHVQCQFMAVDFQGSYRKHACGFLSRDSTGFMEQGHHSLIVPFGGFSASKRHGKGAFFGHPRYGFGAHGLDLFNRPRSVVTVVAYSEGFGQRRER